MVKTLFVLVAEMGALRSSWWVCGVGAGRRKAIDRKRVSLLGRRWRAAWHGTQTKNKASSYADGRPLMRKHWQNLIANK